MGSLWAISGKTEVNSWKIPWGIVSLFDVYVGFFFFIGWIAYRESCPGIVLAWAVAICVGGNVVAGIYAILALLKSKGDTTVFFMGNGTPCCSTKEKEAGTEKIEG
jgi:predicted membrane-bound dolichyl-phosphate-mannose-protein mannosyltransferase